MASRQASRPAASGPPSRSWAEPPIDGLFEPSAAPGAFGQAARTRRRFGFERLRALATLEAQRFGEVEIPLALGRNANGLTAQRGDTRDFGGERLAPRPRPAPG